MYVFGVTLPVVNCHLSVKMNICTRAFAWEVEDGIMVEDWVLQMARDGIHSYSAGPSQDLDNFAAALQQVHCSTAPL